MVTMSDVAKAAGVSRATASYALRGDPRIAPATTDRVLQAARALQYTTNLSARSLRSGRSGLIGVAIFELDFPYPSEMSAAISREVARHGLEAIVQETSNSKESEIAILQKVTSQLCDGTIFSPGNVSDEEIRALSGGKPVVLLDDLSPDPVFDSVATPCEAGTETAIRHLVDIGCRRILVIGANYDMLAEDRGATSVSGRRLIGCLNAFEVLGITPDPSQFVSTEWRTANARAMAHTLVDSGVEFDGAFCMTDSIALGFIRGLADRGVNVPQDAAVIGFDGINECDYYIPSLSTIATDMEDLARKAVGLLLDRIDGGGVPARTLTADYRLVARESTRR
ncbi:Periplasmic binding protein-like domain-containing protein [Bifidobacterium lemurum]|uniref:Periplasmic binding protein-like domain-containing protein n=1 Tax=Bifidobacterium lemurum TaxID=1603886 RepID=A0A261FPF8_9BIFI|nr:LacI family DNA-binding transcriptional regulator [Bifidobacterium lemurum]OZG60978.1 Periplasmic binding protein-like domain-containing protein [Bifidobacterium lemurum]QOL34771.1 LacI family DNA-binding transcriptional regulator [Bifidobacterium lemurum]